MKYSIFYLFLVLFMNAGYSQDGDCDDFSSVDDYGSGPILNDTLGFTEGGTFPILDLYPGYSWHVNDFYPGFFNGGSIRFFFDGSDQIIEFDCYMPYSYEMAYGSFSVNGSADIPFDSLSTMFIGDIEVHIDTSLANDGPDEAMDFYLVRFIGEVDSVTFNSNEMGIVKVCRSEGVLGTQPEITWDSHAAPNPFQDHVQFTSEQLITAISIFNLAGQNLNTSSIQATHQAHLELSNLETGLYIAVLQFNDGSSAKLRLIKN